MVFLDSNLFIIDRFFKRDAAYPATRAFLALLPGIPAAVPLMTLLEICGVASFRLSTVEADRWLHRFIAVYPLQILNPFGADQMATDAWLGFYTDDLMRYIARRMTLGDATLAREADRYGGEAIVTWNVKHFSGKTAVSALTPDEYLNRTS